MPDGSSGLQPCPLRKSTICWGTAPGFGLYGITLLFQPADAAPVVKSTNATRLSITLLVFIHSSNVTTPAIACPGQQSNRTHVQRSGNPTNYPHVSGMPILALRSHSCRITKAQHESCRQQDSDRNAPGPHQLSPIESRQSLSSTFEIRTAE
jgi:hypothetical protein